MSATNRLSIRQATRHDLTGVVRVEKASFGHDAWKRKWFADYLAEPNCAFLVAVKGKSVAGYALALHIRTRSELDSIAVAPSHRGRGAAAALMNRLQTLLRRQGVSTMTLMVRLDNTAAIALYRKFGFTRERRINGYYEDRAPAWRMRATFRSI
jgi:ribosomal-protein-alanine N-acetyltransferase